MTPAQDTRPIRVVLIGSSRFRREFERAARQEAFAGRLPIHMGFFTHADGIKVDAAQQAILDDLDRHRLDLADEVLVIDAPAYWCNNCGGYRQGYGTPIDRVLGPGDPYSNLVCASCNRQTIEVRPYIGESTHREIGYAQGTGKRVRYLSQETTS